MREYFKFKLWALVAHQLWFRRRVAVVDGTLHLAYLDF